VCHLATRLRIRVGLEALDLFTGHADEQTEHLALEFAISEGLAR
jgi:hypothetical protein